MRQFCSGIEMNSINWLNSIKWTTQRMWLLIYLEINLKTVKKLLFALKELRLFCIRLALKIVRIKSSTSNPFQRRKLSIQPDVVSGIIFYSDYLSQMISSLPLICCFLLLCRPLGDSFVAGFFYAYLRNEPIHRCIAKGAEVARQKITSIGANFAQSKNSNSIWFINHVLVY